MKMNSRGKPNERTQKWLEEQGKTTSQNNNSLNYEKKRMEALEELKKCARLDTEPAKTILKLFPELEESDYVIKHRLLDLLNYVRSRGANHTTCDRIQNWVERQGKSGPTNKTKIKPKFEIGDTMRTLQEASNDCSSGLPVIVSIDEEYYHCNNELIAIKDQNNYEYPPINRINKYNFEDGDIVAADPITDYPSSFVAIFHKHETKCFASHCYVGFDGRFHIGQSGHDITNVHPATLKQRAILAKAMDEAGYEWNIKKKELKKIK